MILNIEDNPLSKWVSLVFPFFSWNFNEVAINRWWHEPYYEMMNLNKIGIPYLYDYTISRFDV